MLGTLVACFTCFVVGVLFQPVIVILIKRLAKDAENV